MKIPAGAWIGGLAEWQEGETVYLSVAFTWKLREAYARAMFARQMGYRVIAGGPALFLNQMQHELTLVAEVQKGSLSPDAVARHNPSATVASRGCPEKCTFCIVPKMEGNAFTLLPDFPVRPILCDNNLSALPAEYQDYIVGRYVQTGTPLLDANSGFEPKTFTEDVFRRWAPINRGPWRFAYDELKERPQVLEVMRMLRVVKNPRRKRVYVLIGNEPFDECMGRIAEVLEHGCEPHIQPVMRLNALERRPWVRFDWTEQKLKDVARWGNRRIWKYAGFENYERHKRTQPAEMYDEQQGLFV